MTKSKEEPKRYYWDACVFLSMINANPDRLPIIEALLDDCDQGKVEIYTSILSIAEVAFAEGEKANEKLNAETAKKIDKFWQPPSPIKLIEVHELIMLDARNFIRAAIQNGIGLKPADAIHLATAKRLTLDAIHTYDDKLMRHRSLSQCPLIEPATDRFVFTTTKDPVDMSKDGDGTQDGYTEEAQPQENVSQRDPSTVRESDRGAAISRAETQVKEAAPKEEAK
jgi:predicted nucleic acid-binding protein